MLPGTGVIRLITGYIAGRWPVITGNIVSKLFIESRLRLADK